MKAKRSRKMQFKVVKKRRKKFEPLHRRIATLMEEIQDEVFYYNRIAKRLGGIKKGNYLKTNFKETEICLNELKSLIY